MPKKKELKASENRIQSIIDRLDKLKQGKQQWNIHWQVIAEYFLTRKAIFTTEKQQGEFLNDELFDGVGPNSVMKSASALVGMLWPNGAKSFVLEKALDIPDTTEIKTYYERVTERMADAMDDPKSGLQVALDEYMIDEVSFGTSGISAIRGKKTPVSYKAENVKFMSIDEGPDGVIDTVYIELEWTLRKIVKEYGLENLHPDTRKKFEEGKKLDDDMTVIWCVQPRVEKEEGKEGVLGMDFESMHIEKDTKHLIRESGFKEQPIKVARLRKALNEIYGRSFAMSALPDVEEINAIWEAVTIAIEKKVDPPLAIFSDGALGANVIDTSAGAVNVWKVSGLAGERSPIEPIFTVEEINDAVGLIERLEGSIANHFMLDRLLDFNNETQMTFGEVRVRDRIRGFLLGSLFARQIAELFSPIIERTFNIMFEDGLLGTIEGSDDFERMIKEGIDTEDILIIPQELVKRMEKDKEGNLVGKPPFKIKYISPAARILQAEQAQGIVQVVDFVINGSKANPEIMDNIDFDSVVKELSFIWGAPTKILNSDEAKEQIRKGRDEAAQQQQTIGSAPGAADAIKKLAEAGQIEKEGAKNVA